MLDKFSRNLFDTSWDFKGTNEKPYTHGIHTYPAMMIPPIARRLLEVYSNPGDVVCDIFCGSGTVLVEANLLGRNCYGVDLNPLAVLISKVKTTPLTEQQLRKYFSLQERINQIDTISLKIPSFKNINHWFKDDVIKSLATIKKAIDLEEDLILKDFFLIALSETARLVSTTRRGEYKLHRIKKEDLDNFNPDVFSIFENRCEVNIRCILDFSRDYDKNSWTQIFLGDSSQKNGIKDNSVDCIVTSPPYGDSQTTVAYGQFSRLSAQWIGLYSEPDRASGLDKKLLGGKSINILDNNLESEYLNKSLSEVSSIDYKRSCEVLSFYVGLNESLKVGNLMLKKGKAFCLVIGNRLVRQVRLPTDYIVAELGDRVGLTCEDIYTRKISCKRLPTKTTSNKSKVLEDMMNTESIVILRKRG